MGNLGHQAARLAASKICDNIVKGLCKDPETEVVKLIDMWQKFMGDEKIDLNYDSARRMICDKDCTLNKYMHRLINEIDPHVLKTIALNLGFEAFVYGTKTIRKNREKYGCNVPWLILMDPTSACNLHCTGCWAAEYGHKLNLTFDEMDKVVTQTLQYIYNLSEVARNIYKIIKPGGVALITVPGIKSLSTYHDSMWGEYWSFTKKSLFRMFADVFGENNVEVNSYGNVKTTMAYLYGLSAEMLPEQDFEYNDTNVPFIITAKVKKCQQN